MLSKVSLLSAAIVAGVVFASIGDALADDRAPKVDTSQPTPVVYPLTAQRAGEEGTVVVRVHVSDSGRPMDAAIARTSGYADLDNAAIETALNWRYVPGIRGGRLNDDWATVQVVYTLPGPSRK